MDFSNTVIVMTSNIGAKAITERRSPLGFRAAGEEEGETERKVREELKATFRPEFLNRVDETIIFRRLGQPELQAITRSLLEEVKERFAALGLSLRVPEETERWLAREGCDEKFGARPLRRVLQHRLEDAAAELLLEGRAGPGDEILAAVEDGTLRLQVCRSAGQR